MAKIEKNAEIMILDIQQGHATFQIVGTTPLIFNCVSEKAWRALLGPEATGRKTKADRAQDFKHTPLDEYRNSVYRWQDRDDTPTRLKMPSPAFKGAICTAALDLKGIAKTEIGRLTWIEGYSTSIWGIPCLKMDIVRSADMAKTPDVRTRACLPEWCAEITIGFTQPKLNARTVAQLLAAAGITVGIGDFRQEKGKGDFGKFYLVEDKDATFLRIKKTGGRAAQDAALLNPIFFDDQTERMFQWHLDQVIGKKDQRAETASKRGRKSNGNDADAVIPAE